MNELELIAMNTAAAADALAVEMAALANLLNVGALPGTGPAVLNPAF